MLELDDLDFGGGGGEDGLDPELSFFGSMFFGGEYFAEYIFGVMNFLIFFCFFGLSGFAGADEDGRGVLHKGSLVCKHFYNLLL